MNKRGFTLIELMIVVACMSIIFVPFWSNVEQMVHGIKFQDNKLETSQQAISVFAHIKDFLKTSGNILSADTDRVVFENGQEIMFEDKTGELQIGKKRLKLYKSLVFGPFKMIDYKTFAGMLRVGGDSFPMYWRVGK